MIPSSDLTEPDAAGSDPGGCLAHGVAWLIISAVLLIVMFLITSGCYLLYRLTGG